MSAASYGLIIVIIEFLRNTAPFDFGCNEFSVLTGAASCQVDYRRAMNYELSPGQPKPISHI